MLGLSGAHSIHNEVKIIDNNSFIIFLIIALAGSAGVFVATGNYFKKLTFRFSPGIKGTAILTYSVIEMTVLFLFFVLSATYIAVNNYSPFLYFRF
jgi:hypothetical protein